MATRGAVLVGHPGTGKDATGQQLPKKLKTEGLSGWHYFSVGTETFRRLAENENVTLEKFIEKCDTDPQYDRKIDVDSLQKCDEGEKFIITARTIPALLTRRDIYPVENTNEILKIRFDCDLDVRINRVLKRDFKKAHGGQDPTPKQIADLFESVKEATLAREKKDALRYAKYYGISDILADKYFDEIIDTTHMTLDDQIEETFNTLMNYLED